MDQIWKVFKDIKTEVILALNDGMNIFGNIDYNELRITL